MKNEMNKAKDPGLVDIFYGDDLNASTRVSHFVNHVAISSVGVQRDAARHKPIILLYNPVVNTNSGRSVYSFTGKSLAPKDAPKCHVDIHNSETTLRLDTTTGKKLGVLIKGIIPGYLS